MNKTYIYIDDLVEVKNEFNETKILNYSDNIEEILITENVIEQIELEQIKLLNEKNHNENISYKLLKKCIFTLLSIPIVLIVLPFITGIIKLNTLPITACLLAITISTSLSVFLIYKYNKTNKINVGIDYGLNYLENNLNNEKQKLVQLKQNINKQDNIINTSVSKIVDDIEELKRLKETLLLYYDCGYHQDKYLKYLKQGELKDKLLKYYNEEQIKMAEECLKNKANILIK